MNITSYIAKELSIRNEQVDSVIKLLKEDATIPFIARYRKEHTGGLDEEVLRNVEDRLSYLTILEERKETILNSINEQGKLTDELKTKILDSVKLTELEDLYLPYKPKRRTRGTIAKAKGLEPLALFLLDNPKFNGNLEEKLSEFINAELGVNTTDEALHGAKDIIAEMINDDAEVRKSVREYLQLESVIKSERVKEKASTKEISDKQKEKDKKEIYQIYYEFSIDIKKIKPYQLLALNRGEKEKALKISFNYDEETIIRLMLRKFLKYEESVFMDIFKETTQDAFTRLTFPSIEREIRTQLTES